MDTYESTNKENEYGDRIAFFVTKIQQEPKDAKVVQNAVTQLMVG